MKNKKKESFDIDYFNQESFNIEEEETDAEKILSLDELLDNEVQDGDDDLIQELIDGIFG